VILLKGDLVVLAGLVTFFGFFDFGTKRMVATAMEGWPGVLSLILAALLGVVLMGAITAEMAKSPQKRQISRMRDLTMLLVVVHMFAYTMVLGYSSIVYEQRGVQAQQELAVDDIEPYVQQVYQKHGALPRDNESFYNIDGVRRAIERSSEIDTLYYRRIGERSYSIRASGADGELGDGQDVAFQTVLRLEED
jgi:hypothetical protein